MSSIITINGVQSVPSTFSWDSGDYNVTSNSVVSVTNGSTQTYYIGYAPAVDVSVLTYTNSVTSLSSSYFARLIDFGDYYNTGTNTFAVEGTNPQLATHRYIMPGVYSISVAEANYLNTNFLTENAVELKDSKELAWINIPATTTDNGEILYNSSVALNNITASVLISVVEIPPTAYLESDFNTKTQGEMHFPFTVILTPKYTQTGSFPIDSIAWNLGNGTPTFYKRRWDSGVTSSSMQYNFNFVYNSAYPNDPDDPRNYDINYTYVGDGVNDTFYPSITAYASSTSTSDSVSLNVGPLMFENYNSTKLDNKIDLVQTELNDDQTSLFVTQVGTNIGVWTTK